MSRIKQITESAERLGRKLLIPYLVAGDPDNSRTVALMHSLVKSGADIIELGIPFSDPSSDGPVIQRAVERSLARGTSLKDTFEIVSEFRQSNTATPVVLMGYLNPLEIMGYDVFVERILLADVDGVLIVDMPPRESEKLRSKLQKAEIDTIFLVAPTTKKSRAKDIIQRTSGYLYYVSLKGVTGAAIKEHETVSKKLKELRVLTKLPIVIGFGIKDEQSAKSMAKLGDGVVVGSALVDRIGSLSIEGSSQDNIDGCTNIIKAMREAINDLD